jgi:hypothetical protein
MCHMRRRIHVSYEEVLRHWIPPLQYLCVAHVYTALTCARTWPHGGVCLMTEHHNLGASPCQIPPGWHAYQAPGSLSFFDPEVHVCQAPPSRNVSTFSS